MEIFIKKGVFILLLMAFIISKAQVAEDSKIILSPEPIENITLHTDRDIYLCGEIIWFNAYCLTDENTSESTFSNVLYIELFNHSKSAIIRQKIKIKDRFAQGSIEIPKDFLSDNYYLRAYTQFLKNYPPETYFTTLITIINPTIPLPINKTEIAIDHIDLIPEYGSLIDGVSSKIAFRIHDHVKQILKNISVTDNLNNVLANPQSTKNGLGLFEITPQISKTYFLKLKLNNNDSIIKQLPKVNDEGIVIKQGPYNENNIILNIVNKQISDKDKSKQEYLLNINSENNQVLFETSINLVDEITEYTFSKNLLINGLNYMILKERSGKVVQVSSFYYHDDVDIPLKLDHQSKIYSQRELVNLDLIPESINLNSMLNLSISVVKKGTINQLPSYIFDDPQLLKSYVEKINPGSLEEDDKNILTILYNNWMLTEPYSTHSRTDTIYYDWLPEIRDVSISGIVYDKQTLIPFAKIPIYISVFKNNPQIHIVNSQTNGEFIFSLNDVESIQDIFLCPISEDQNNLEIKIKTDFSTEFPLTKNIPLSINPSHELMLKEMFINQQTNNIYKISTSSKLNPLYQYDMNIIQPKVSVILDDFINLNSLETVFREIVPNCMVRKRNGRSSIYIADAFNSFISENPLILIDNIPVFDVDELFKIPPSKIIKIEANPSSLVLGNNVIKGLIKLTTNTENFGGIIMPESSTFLKYQTLEPSYKFEAPMYNTEEKRKDRQADFRTLLYWNPNISTTGNTAVSFYTSDHCSEYEVIVRGITKDGKNCYGRTSFNVVAK